MIGDGGIDMDEIDFGVFQDFGIVGEAVFDLKSITDQIQVFFVSLANGINVGVRVRLVNRNELSTETESNHGNVDLLTAHWLETPRKTHD